MASAQNVGKLDRYVTIEANTPSVSGTGQRTESWATITNGARFAEITYLSGPEFVAASQVNAEVAVRIRVRYLSTITPAMRVLYGSIYFDIVRVAEVGRGEYLDLFCKSQRTT